MVKGSQSATAYMSALKGVGDMSNDAKDEMGRESRNEIVFRQLTGWSVVGFDHFRSSGSDSSYSAFNVSHSMLASAIDG